MGNKQHSRQIKVVADNQQPEHPQQAQQRRISHKTNERQVELSTEPEEGHEQAQGAGILNTSTAGRVDNTSTTPIPGHDGGGQCIPTTLANQPSATRGGAAEQPTEGARKIEKGPTTRGAGGCTINSISGGTNEPLPIRRQPQQHQQHQQQHQHALTSTTKTCAGLTAAGGAADSTDNQPPVTFAATATDGYISFSESDQSEMDPSSHLSVSATNVPEQQASSGVKVSHDCRSPKLAIGGGKELQQHLNQLPKDFANRGGGKNSSDDEGKWDFGDDSADKRDDRGKEAESRVESYKTRQDLDEPNARRDQKHEHPPHAGSKIIQGIGVFAPGSPATGNGCGGNDSAAEEPQKDRVVVDRLGRRQNVPRRVSSSSSSEDDFDGWGDDDKGNGNGGGGGEEDEDEEEGDVDDTDEDDDGHVYDWTRADTGEGAPDGEPGEMDGTRKRSEGPSSENSKSTASAAKPRAEANPLASKLGLSASVPRAVAPSAMAAAAAPLQRQGPGRGPGWGPGSGRGSKAVAPGRAGRPLYSPLTQGLPQHVRPQGPPLADAITMAGVAAVGGDPNNKNKRNSNSDGGPTSGLLSKPPGIIAQSSPAAGAIANNHIASSPPLTPNGGKGGPGAGITSPGTTILHGGTGASPAAGAVAATPSASSSNTTAPFSPVVPRVVHLSNTSAQGGEGEGEGGGGIGGRGGGGQMARPLSGAGGAGRGGCATSAVPAGYSGDSFATGAGGRGKPASSGPAVPAAGGRRATVGAVAAGANGPPRSGAVPRAGEAAAAVGSPKEPEAVIDTANVTRKKAQLPQQEQLEHPTPVGGSWLKNRYIVNNYILLESLGTGSYAEVRLAKEKTSNKLYAVKIMNKDFLKRKQVGKEETFMDSIKREIAIMKEVRHPNVLQLYEVMDDPKVNKLYLVLEYCKKGDLMNILNGDTRAATCDPMNDTDVWYIMRQIVQGLSFLHQHNIIHGDIKPQNLLVGSDNVAKIADFGISKFVQGSGQQLQEQAGTPTFMSPELCCGKCYSGQLADVWALGATMYMIRCGKPPFMANQVMALYEKIQNDPLDFPPEVSMSAGLRRILRAMMEKEPAKRTALDQVVSDRWIQQGDCGYARTAAAGNTPTTTTAPTSSTNTTIPSTAAATPPLYGGLSLHTAFSGGNAIGSSGGSGGSGGVGAPPRNGVGPGLRPPPTVSILPSTEQGNRTIKVSYDEVPRSINQNATTGGYHGPGSAGGCGARGSLLVQQQQRTLAASSTTLPILQGTTAAGAPHALAGVSGGGSPSPLASPLGVGTGVGEGRQEGGGGGGGTKRESGIGRGDLSETEESWKCRSFQKIKEKNDGDPRFRGGTATSTVAPNSAEAAAATAAATVGATPAPLCSSSTAAAHHHQNRQQQKQQQHASGQGGRDTATRTRSDSFSGDGSESDCYSSENDPDTVYEQEGSDGGTPTASPRFAGVVPASPSSPSSRAANASEAASRQKAVPPVGQPRGGISPRGESVGNTGADGGTRVGVSMQQQESGRCASARRRSSSERFAAVMDTLAAQPSKESRGPEGASSRREGPSGGSNSGDWSPTYSGSSCPPRDLSLRGVRVTSSPSAAAGRLSSSAAAAAMPGECLCNRRLGLVAASSQRQGKRASQEDRTTVCADLETALAGKVERAYRYQHYALFGVFDGHNGQMCSEALHAGLHVAVAKQPVFHQALDKALIQAFNGFDKDLRVRQEQEGDTSGSTALLVVFDGNSRTLLVANAGDSRCVSSSRAGVATRLSSDHRLSRPDELERVLTNGGFVTNNRINGVLAVSRSFGDVQHKDGTSPGLIATPELRSERVTSSAPSSGDGGGSGGLLEFVILATDGLWDVVEDQEAVNFVRLHLFENDGDLSGAARGLTKLALDQGSVDNVSAVLVWLDEDTDEVVQQQQQPPPQHQIFLQQQGQYHRPHFKQHVAPD